MYKPSKTNMQRTIRAKAASEKQQNKAAPCYF